PGSRPPTSTMHARACGRLAGPRVAGNPPKWGAFLLLSTRGGSKTPDNKTADRPNSASGGHMRTVLRVLLVGFTWAAVPARLLPQGAITGVVKDASGAVMPGVTVEAASPALIEKVRAVVSDDTGQYRIVDLRTGIYSVTFSLTGFSTVKREG